MPTNPHEVLSGNGTPDNSVNAYGAQVYIDAATGIIYTRPVQANPGTDGWTALGSAFNPSSGVNGLTIITDLPNENITLTTGTVTPSPTGDGNVRIGYLAGASLTSGREIVAIGAGALSSYTTTGAGIESGLGVAIGSLAGNEAVSNEDFVYIGQKAGEHDQGSGTICIGAHSGLNFLSGDNNIAIGNSAGDDGIHSGSLTGTNNILIGTRAGAGITGSAAGNTFIGFFSARLISTGSQNVCMGQSSGENLSTAVGNVFIGYLAGNLSTTQGGNTFVGWSSGQGGTTGADNTYLGYLAGQQNSTGGDNTYIGWSAGRNATGNFNTIIGSTAATNLSSGEQNVYIGTFSGNSVTTGGANTTVGTNAGHNNSTGSQNVNLGNSAGYAATGNNGVYLGYRAGVSVTSGTDNICIGAVADLGTGTFTNTFVVGTGTIATASNQATIGNTSLAQTRLNGTVDLQTVGATVSVKSGTNGLSGTVTLVAGAATITSTAIDVNTVIVLSVKTTGGTPGTFMPRSNVAAGSATITGLSTDTSTYNWIAFKVA